VLVNNAGIMATPLKLTEDQFEEQFQANHLGHFLLTNLLLDALKKSQPSRIVVLASKAHLRWGNRPIDWSKLARGSDHSDYEPFVAYGRSKLCNILFTIALNKRLREDPNCKVCVNACHPGLVDTGLLVTAGMDTSRAIPVSDGVKTPLLLATSEDVNIAGVSGQYWYQGQICNERTQVSVSEEQAELLWKNSSDFVGITK